MKYAKIKKRDIANGTGVRVSVFVSGCENYCKGCFNSEAWDFNYGNEFTNDTVNEIIEAAKPDFIAGLSILGGEPLHPKNISEVLMLAGCFKQIYPNKTVWLYTGYKIEEVPPVFFDDMKTLDVIVDGPFIEDLKDVSLTFRGSSNQRIIDWKSSISERKIVTLDLDRKK